ncbi:MAG: hypothetical protein LQ350_008111 [Teloschistes chrysophthalmus]|nr:MAG: hypothetical protein LQ350_008111 [Niorma chrysophthalma]
MLAQVIRSGEYLHSTDEQDKRFVREPNLIEHETARFWEDADFAGWKAVHIDGESETKKGPPYLYKNDMSMERTPPVAYFLNLCNMDWRWPTLMDGAEVSFLRKGADPLCGLFKDEVNN